MRNDQVLGSGLEHRRRSANGNEDAWKIQACCLPALAQCLLGLEASPGQDRPEGWGL